MAKSGLKCGHCKIVKSLDDFYRASTPRGYRYKCKICEKKCVRAYQKISTKYQEYIKKYQKEWLKNNIEKCRAKNNAWKKAHRAQVNIAERLRKSKIRPHMNAIQSKRRAINPAHHYELWKASKSRYPEKHVARKKLNHAIEGGKIKKRNICEICYKSPTDCHHEDYTKPFNFVELCRQCHSTLHYTLNLTKHA
jgi:hypothetical protein